jgi:predicted NAD-dependent protein-ADP-ribosyltransferase YbiA (DUF1768 family)
MFLSDRTYRILDDGEHIEGTWRHIFIKNGPTYFLTDLKIYADGMIDCWGLVDIDEFRDKLRTGWVATTLTEDIPFSAHHLASWRATEAQCINGDTLLAEVIDTIARLQGTPTSVERFGDALTTFLADGSESNRSLLRDAYADVPEHLRRYLIADQDLADWPVKVLIGEPGELVHPRNPPWEPRPITEENRQTALSYFATRETRAREWQTTTNNNDPDGPPAGITTSVGEGGTTIAPSGGWVNESGDGYLSNDTPFPVVVDGVSYPSVTHAYWCLATSDPDSAEAIRLAPRASEANDLGMAAPRKPGWSGVRLAVMTGLMLKKFEQHPDLAAKLLSTGDARIVSPHSFIGSFWSPGHQGRNWVGRILELVRSELRLRGFNQS